MMADERRMPQRELQQLDFYAQSPTFDASAGDRLFEAIRPKSRFALLTPRVEMPYIPEHPTRRYPIVALPRAAWKISLSSGLIRQLRRQLLEGERDLRRQRLGRVAPSSLPRPFLDPDPLKKGRSSCQSR